MIALTFILAILLRMGSSIVIDCAHNKHFKVVTEYFFDWKGLVCVLKDDGQGEITIDSKVLEKNPLITLIYTNKSVPILTPEVHQILPNIKFCIIHNISSIQLKRDWFKYSGNLSALKIEGNNKIRYLEGRLFVDLLNLTILDVQKNFIENIDKDAFVGLKKLKFFRLWWNKLEFVSPKVFRNLESLERLYLSHNPIKSLDPTTFHHLLNLKEMNLEETSLQSLPDGIFEKNLKLTYITVKYSNISRIPKNIFSHLKDLTYINFEDNGCTSQIISQHSSSFVFTEDILLPCSCKLNEGKFSWVFKRFLICSLAIVGMILMFLVSKRIKKNLEERYHLKHESKFNIGEE